jgi:hypothetical protein
MMSGAQTRARNNVIAAHVHATVAAAKGVPSKYAAASMRALQMAAGTKEAMARPIRRAPRVPPPRLMPTLPDLELALIVAARMTAREIFLVCNQPA